MTGETIFGIDMIDGEVAPTAGGGMLSLRMVLFSYVKMEDKFSIFAELHQTEELGPVFAIIPACSEAERLVHMMNKQVRHSLTANGILTHRPSPLPKKRRKTMTLKKWRMQHGGIMPLI